MRASTLFAFILALMAVASDSHPQEYNPDNGHYYYLISISPGHTWHQCRDSALALNGYLASVTSQSEADFLYGIIVPYSVMACYLGGTDEINDGTWEWVSGETFSFTNWRPGEPNSSNEYEDYIAFSIEQDGKWNDIGSSFAISGFFIVEWNELPGIVRLVPDDYPTIQSAIDASFTGDTVLVAPGTYNEHLYIDRAIDIFSTSGPDATTISGGGSIIDTASSVLTIIDADQVSVNGFTIEGGRGLMTSEMENARGGGIFVSNTKLTVENCIVTGNSAAAIDLYDMAGGGGGIYADSSARLTILNSEIRFNSVAEGAANHTSRIFGGGGVLSQCDSIEIMECTISNNSVYTESNLGSLGGGLLLKGSYCSIYNSMIDSNVATHFYNTAAGGGVYVDAGFVSISQCEIRWNKTEWNGIDNSPSAEGGGAYTLAESLFIKNCNFLYNESVSRGLHYGHSAGGGLYASSSIYDIDSNIFSGNKAVTDIPTSTSHTVGSAEGGAIHIQGSGIIQRSRIIGNRCEALIGGGVTCRGSAFGGGLWGVATIRGCTFYGNICRAETGGADSYEEVSCYGGGVYGSPVISETVIDSCIATAFSYTAIPLVDGGGVMTENPDALSCSDFWNNVPNHVSGSWSPETYQNLISDPLFCPDSGAFAIYDVSPCAPENNPCGILIGAGSVHCSGKPSLDTICMYGEVASNVVMHTPTINWSFYCPLGNPEDSFNIAVGTDSDWQHAEMWNPAPFPGPDTSVTYAGATLIDGQTYYLRLRVHNGLAWSDWYEMSFRMNSVPSVPELLSPVDGEIIDVSNPTLYIQNSTDPEGDPLTYDYIVYDDSENVYTEVYGVEEQTDSTGWVIDLAVQDNRPYSWWVRADDSYEPSAWSPIEWFWVNTIEDFPADFYLFYPPDTGWSQVYEFPTEFIWTPSFDNDPNDSVFYRLIVATDSNFTFDVEYDSIYSTTYLVPSLDYYEHYWWKVYAIDTKGNITQSSGVADFMTWILGDVDADYSVTVADAVFLINYIFKGGDAPDPLKIGDVNGDCLVDVADAVYLINYVFKGGQEPQVGCGEISSHRKVSFDYSN